MNSNEKHASTINFPKWKKGWTDKEGRKKQGFWYVWNGSRRIALARYGAPRTNRPKKATYDAALKARQALLDDLRASNGKREILARTHRVTVGDVVERYKRDVWPKCKPGSKWPDGSGYFFRLFCEGHDGSRYRNSKPVPPYAGWGDEDAESITERDIRDWYLHHKWSETGCRNGMVALKAAFGHAKKVGLINTNPLAGLVTRREKSEKTLFTSKTEKAYREAAERLNPAFYLFWQANRDIGPRPDELAQLKPRHMRTSPDGNIYWRLEWHEWKNGDKGNQRKHHNLILPQKWQDWMETRLAECGPDDFLFQTERGKGWKKTNWVNHNIAVRKEAKDLLPDPTLDRVTLYSCRHTRITERVKANESPRLIAILHGTSVKEIESTYCHTEDDVDFLNGVV